MIKVTKPNTRELTYAAIAGASSYVLSGIKPSRTTKSRVVSAAVSTWSYLVFASLGAYRN